MTIGLCAWRASAPLGTSPRRFRVWVGPSFGALALKRLLVTALLAPSLFLLATWLGFPAMGLLLGCVAVWPLPLACMLGQEAVRVSWLFVSERLRYAEIARAEVVADPRRWVIGPRRPVLRIHLRSGAQKLIHASPGTVIALGRGIEARRESGSPHLQH